MNIETLTLIIALWGGVLSTILAIRELMKDRRSLKIIFESVHWIETFRILITNTAERPITITGINLALEDKEGRGVDQIRPSAYWATEGSYAPPALPLSLKDGELAIFWLSEILSNEIHQNKNTHIEIRVYDAEGHVYSKYSEGQYDPKWEYRSGKYKPPNIFIRLKWRFQEFFWKRKRQ
jgi:hypothetical protein